MPLHAPWVGCQWEEHFFGDNPQSVGGLCEAKRFRHIPCQKVLNHKNDIARLKGARLVSAVEVERGERLAAGLVKQVTGQDMLQARFLYQEHFEFVPEFKIFLAVNHKPPVDGSGYAMWRRVHLIPFNVRIPEDEQDRELPKKLEEELPGILKWAVDG